MNITKKQRSVIWLVIALITIYYALSVILSMRQASFARQQAAQQRVAQRAAGQIIPKVQAGAGAGTPVADIAPAPAAPSIADRMGSLVGTWLGRALLPNRGTCSLQIDLEGGPDQFSGRSSLGCAPLLPTQPRMNPSFAVISGKEEKGSLNLAVDKFIGATPEIRSCVITSFSLTPFGPGQMIAQWQDGCEGGQILMQKAKS